MSLPELLALIFTYAIVDSFDPCIYTLFVLILTSAIFIDIKYAVKVGGTYLMALYLGYITFGTFLRYLVVRVPTQALAVVMLLYGLLNLSTSLKRAPQKELICREDELPCKVASALRLNKLVGKGVTSVFILGVISSFTLLPCSAGLYVAYNIVTKTYEFSVWVLLTLLYVAIFISPLVLLFLAVVFISRLRAINEFILKGEREIKIAGSLIMIATAIYILSQGVNTYMY